VATDGAAQNVIRYISSHGMTLGDHTVHHYDLTTLSDAQVAAEITGVETTLQQVLGNPSLRLTLFRAPYGSPYLGGSAAQIARIGAIVRQHAAEIGRAIDPQDYNCAE
jgi:peptidoglycan/xylan/chitin deacetylase (PgdA/CDA1 family)